MAQILAPVVQKVDSAIHWVNHYTVNNAIGCRKILTQWIVIYPVGSAIQLLNNRV